MIKSLLVKTAIAVFVGAIAFTPTLAASLKVVAERNVFGGAILRITNIGDGPVRINSVEINNGTCRATVSNGYREVPNPNIPRDGVTSFQHIYISSGIPEKVLPPRNNWDARSQQQATPPPTQKQSSWCPVISPELRDAFYNTHNNVGCFDHEPTEAEIENFKKPTKNLTITVEDTKDLGGVTLIVGQSTTGRVACSPGVTDIVRATVATDQGSQTYEFQ